MLGIGMGLGSGLIMVLIWGALIVGAVWLVRTSFLMVNKRQRCQLDRKRAPMTF